MLRFRQKNDFMKGGEKKKQKSKDSKQQWIFVSTEISVCLKREGEGCIADKQIGLFIFYFFYFNSSRSGKVSDWSLNQNDK